MLNIKYLSLTLLISNLLIVARTVEGANDQTTIARLKEIHRNILSTEADQFDREYFGLYREFGELLKSLRDISNQNVSRIVDEVESQAIARMVDTYERLKHLNDSETPAPDNIKEIFSELLEDARDLRGCIGDTVIERQDDLRIWIDLIDTLLGMQRIHEIHDEYFSQDNILLNGRPTNLITPLMSELLAEYKNLKLNVMRGDIEPGSVLDKKMVKLDVQGAILYVNELYSGLISGEGTSRDDWDPEAVEILRETVKRYIEMRDVLLGYEDFSHNLDMQQKIKQLDRRIVIERIEDIRPRLSILEDSGDIPVDLDSHIYGALNEYKELEKLISSEIETELGDQIQIFKDLLSLDPDREDCSAAWFEGFYQIRLKYQSYPALYNFTNIVGSEHIAKCSLKISRELRTIADENNAVDGALGWLRWAKSWIRRSLQSQAGQNQAHDEYELCSALPMKFIATSMADYLMRNEIDIRRPLNVRSDVHLSMIDDQVEKLWKRYCRVIIPNFERYYNFVLRSLNYQRISGSKILKDFEVIDWMESYNLCTRTINLAGRDFILVGLIDHVYYMNKLLNEYSPGADTDKILHDIEFTVKIGDARHRILGDSLAMYEPLQDVLNLSDISPESCTSNIYASFRRLSARFRNALKIMQVLRHSADQQITLCQAVFRDDLEEMLRSMETSHREAIDILRDRIINMLDRRGDKKLQFDTLVKKPVPPQIIATNLAALLNEPLLQPSTLDESIESVRESRASNIEQRVSKGCVFVRSNMTSLFKAHYDMAQVDIAFSTIDKISMDFMITFNICSSRFFPRTEPEASSSGQTSLQPDQD